LKNRLKAAKYEENHMKVLALHILFVLIGIILVWVGILLGLWWLAIVIGFLLGFVKARTLIALLLSLSIGGLGWGLPLFYRSFQLPIGNVASLVASILGIGSANGWIVVVLTVLLGIFFCIVGAWVGSASRQIKILYLHHSVTI